MSKLDLQTLLGVPTLPSNLKRINQEIEAALSAAEPTIRDAALRHLRAPGKRLRPVLTLAVMRALGKPVAAKGVSACASIELVHISSLIHDDIMDKAASRRGIPTIHTQEGLGTAIISGDYLLAQACAEAAGVSAETVQLITAAIISLCNGQTQEVADEFKIERDGERMLQSIRNKTAALFAAACRIGGVTAGLKSAELDALAAYGENFGMAFQLINDVLDFVSTEELLGKATGTDLVEGVYTMPVLLALHGQEQAAVRTYLEDRSPLTPAFVELLISEYAIGKTVEVAKEFAARARASIAPLQRKSHDFSHLAAFPEAYIAWSLDNLIAPEYHEKLLPA